MGCEFEFSSGQEIRQEEAIIIEVIEAGERADEYKRISKALNNLGNTINDGFLRREYTKTLKQIADEAIATIKEISTIKKNKKYKPAAHNRGHMNNWPLQKGPRKKILKTKRNS